MNHLSSIDAGISPRLIRSYSWSENDASNRRGVIRIIDSAYVGAPQVKSRVCKYVKDPEPLFECNRELVSAVKRGEIPEPGGLGTIGLDYDNGRLAQGPITP